MASRERPAWIFAAIEVGSRLWPSTIHRVFRPSCVHGLVIKRINKNRVVKVGTKLVDGSESKLAVALERSEDSTKPNLTLRQGWRGGGFVSATSSGTRRSLFLLSLSDRHYRRTTEAEESDLAPRNNSR